MFLNRISQYRSPMGYTSSLGGMEFLHSVPSKSNHTQYIYMFSVLTENEERITINTFLFGASFLVQKKMLWTFGVESQC